MAIDIEINDGIGEVVINNPPVNALGSKAWFEFADGVKKLGENPDVNLPLIHIVRCRRDTLCISR